MLHKQCLVNELFVLENSQSTRKPLHTPPLYTKSRFRREGTYVYLWLLYGSSVQLNSVQSLSLTLCDPTDCAHHTSLSITSSRSSLKLMSVESVMPSNRFILCRPLLLPSSIFPSIRVFSNESALRIRWPKYWRCSFSISPSSEYSGLSFLAGSCLCYHMVFSHGCFLIKTSVLLNQGFTLLRYDLTSTDYICNNPVSKFRSHSEVLEVRISTCEFLMREGTIEICSRI